MKPRLNIYIDYELHKKLEQAAPQLGGSKSGVVEAALISFFSLDGGDRREAAIVRRLDRLSRQFDRLARNWKSPGKPSPLTTRLELVKRPQQKILSSAALYPPALRTGA